MIIILHSRKIIQEISFFFYRNFYFLSTSYYFFYQKQYKYRRSTINKIHPFLTQSSHIWPKDRVQASVSWSSATVNRLMFESPVQRAEETRTTIFVARGTHENGRPLLPREGSAFRERQHDKRRLGKNFEDDTCTWDARQTANLRWRTAYNHVPSMGSWPFKRLWRSNPILIYLPSASMRASFAVRK